MTSESTPISKSPWISKISPRPFVGFRCFGKSTFSRIRLRTVKPSTLGIGIGILQRVKVLEFVERFIKPTMVQNLAAGASDFVKDVHSHQYDETARDITGATFMAMGQLSDYEIARDWSLMRVMLGHRDRRMLKYHEEHPAAHRRLERRLAEPSIYQSFLRYLKAFGYAIPADILKPNETVATGSRSPPRGAGESRRKRSASS